MKKSLMMTGLVLGGVFLSGCVSGYANYEVRPGLFGGDTSHCQMPVQKQSCPAVVRNVAPVTKPQPVVKNWGKPVSVQKPVIEAPAVVDEKSMSVHPISKPSVKTVSVVKGTVVSSACHQFDGKKCSSGDAKIKLSDGSIINKHYSNIMLHEGDVIRMKRIVR